MPDSGSDSGNDLRDDFEKKSREMDKAYETRKNRMQADFNKAYETRKNEMQADFNNMEFGFITFVIVVGIISGILFLYNYRHRSRQKNVLADVKMKENPSLSREEAMALAELDIMKARPVTIRR